MGLCAQIGLLMWKNGKLMWRSKLVTIVEFVVPLLVTVILLLIKNEPETKRGKNYPSENISFSSNYYDLGYSYAPGLENQTKQLMDELKLFNGTGGNSMFTLYNKSQLVGFLNETDEYGYQRSNRIGVYFTRIQPGAELHYSFLMPRSDWYRRLGSFWQDDDPFSYWRSHDPSRSSSYLSSGLLSFQLAIDLSFIGKKELANASFFLQQLPQESIQRSNYMLLATKVTFVFQLFWLLPLLFIMLFLANKLVVEKETGIKIYMSVMGLHPMAFYQSHLIFGQIKTLAVMTLFAVILSTELRFVNPVILVVLAVLYGFAMLYLAALTTTIVRTHQLCQLLVIIVAITCFVLALLLLPEQNQIGLCLLASLNPIAAFRLGMEQAIYYERKVHPLGFSALFSSTQFTVGLTILMLLVDCLLFNVLIYYLDAVLPTDDSPKKHPLFFMRFEKSKGKELKGQQNDGFDLNSGDDDSPKIPMENMEPEQETPDSAEPNIDIRNMSKQWGTKMAVNNLNFRARQGQITVLLGQNGAGKTTTFSAITGSIRCSSGQVLICGQDLATNLGECRKKMGYCPQNNPLFNSLTVRDHLRFYACLKSSTFNGPDCKAALEQETAYLIQAVGLADKSTTQAGKLSGGQKRKLCVAIALVGKSQVVLLDEPTAGMDVQARAAVGELLAEAKKYRTILLTTHYMDEADKLGDRIGIMVDGRLMCCGSPEFLKAHFGVGYILSLVCTGFDGNLPFSDAVQQILSVIRQHSPNAELERAHAPEIKVLLPSADKQRFAHLFDELEQSRQRLAIDSFGLSENALEEVFLKVGEPNENGHEEGQTRKERTADAVEKKVQEIFNTNRRQTRSGILLCLQQLLALLQRQLLWTLRNPLRSLTPLAIAVLFFLLIGFAVTNKFSKYQVNKRSLSIDDVQESVKVVMQLKGEYCRSQFQSLSAHLCPKCSLVQLDAATDLQSALLKEQFDSPPYIAAGVAVQWPNVTAIYNEFAWHSQPMALSLATNGLLGANSFAIRPSIELFKDRADNGGRGEYEKKDQKILQNIFAAIAIILCFVIFRATMIVPLIQEKIAKFKYQLLLTQLHFSVYWAAIFVWNLLLYSLYCLLILSFLLIFDWMKDGRADLCLVWALFLWAYVPMNGLLSFYFIRGQRAFTVVLIYDFIIADILLGITMFLRMLLRMNGLADVLEIIFLLISPGYGLFNAVSKILNKDDLRKMEMDATLDKNIYTVLASGILFWVLIALVESWGLFIRLRRRLCTSSKQANPSAEEVLEAQQQEDPDVSMEYQRVQRFADSHFAVAVRKLCKSYGSFPAVHELTFGVQRQECFGLLGPNGAGKTTTFDILTGFQYASSGRASIERVDVSKRPSIGYCPQFDALPMDLTGREVLTLLARLNGFKNAGNHVDHVLWCIRMEVDADRKVEQYSGGQRRRISVGVTLLTRSGVIMLDEPTAGIDPIARHHIWQVLHAATRQQNMAMLLTSHSMDECEALCNRIGFMNKGRLIGVGSGQHLKSRFGNSYLLTISVANPSENIGEFLNNVVIAKLNALPTTDLATAATLHWEIPKMEDVPWAVLYRKVQQLAEEYAQGMPDLVADDVPVVVDFSLTQNSLEQVFLRLSAM